MARSHLSEDEIRQTVSAVEMHRNPDGTIRLLETARYLRMPPRTLSHRIDKLKLDRKKFTAPFLPSESRTLDELVRDRIEESRRSKNADDARNLIPIQINIDGPFGLLIFGDPHVDDGGTDFELLAAHRQIAIDHPFVVSGSIGDHQNGWIGRLGSLYGSQMTTAKEAWKLVEWLVSPLNWLFLIGGNHDLWAGAGDPLDWIARQNNSIYEPHGIRMVLNHPCGAKTRIHCRHDFSGNSIYHALHGPKREVLMGFRDHLIVAGHKHIGGAEQLVTPDGLVAQLVRVSGYKHVDHYANQLGLKKMPMHPSALIIIDPREPDTSAARCWCAPTVERGILFLDALRAQYKPVVKRSRK